MTAIDRLELELTDWLVETAVPLGSDDIDSLIRQTAGVRQRPRWSFPERWLRMSDTTLPRPILRSFPVRPVAVLIALVLLVAALVAVGIGSRPRFPAPFAPAANGQVAMARGGDLFLVDPETGIERPLVAGTAPDDYPVFSPDGTKVAFERAAGGSTLMIVGIDGGAPIAASERVIGIYGLQWSPDGSSLVFVNGDLVVVAADGSGGGALPIAARTEGYPMWRPDGKAILFLGSLGGVSGSYLVRPDGSDLRPITQADGSIVNDGLAQWLPDGHRILTRRFESADGGPAQLRLHVMTIDDSGRVTEDRVVGPALKGAAIGYSLPRDGTRAISAIPQSDGATWRVGVIPLDGGPVVETGPSFLSTDVGVAWSPDGQSIVAHDPVSPVTLLLDPNGGEPRTAPWTSDSDDVPSWQAVAP